MSVSIWGNSVAIAGLPRDPRMMLRMTGERSVQLFATPRLTRLP